MSGPSVEGHGAVGGLGDRGDGQGVAVGVGVVGQQDRGADDERGVLDLVTSSVSASGASLTGSRDVDDDGAAVLVPPRPSEMV